MKKIILVLTLILYQTSISQNKSIAKAYYLKARETFSNEKYQETLELLQKTKKELNNTNPDIAYLEFHSYLKYDKYNYEIVNLIDYLMENFNSTDSRKDEISLFFVNNNKLIEQIKTTNNLFLKTKNQQEKYELAIKLLNKDDSFEVGLSTLNKLADNNNINAINTLGELYFNGKLIKKSYDLATAYFENSADKNNSIGQYYIGLINYKGYGKDVNRSEAYKYFLLSAKQNNHNAQAFLVEMYIDDLSTEMPIEQVYDFAKKSADSGNKYGLNVLGCLYERGIHVQQNFTKAFELNKQSAEMGNTDAMSVVASLYYTGNGIEKSNSNAELWCKKCLEIEPEHIICNYNLGSIYLEDQNKVSSGLKLIKKSANQNLKEAQYVLGLYSLQNVNDISSKKEAIEWFEKSAKQGFIYSQAQLSQLYWDNDLKKSVKYGTMYFENPSFNEKDYDFNYSVANGLYVAYWLGNNTNKEFTKDKKKRKYWKEKMKHYKSLKN